MGVFNALKPRLKRAIERRAKPRVMKMKVLQICQTRQALWKCARQVHIIVKTQTPKVGQVVQRRGDRPTQRVHGKIQTRQVGQVAQFGRDRTTQRVHRTRQGWTGPNSDGIGPLNALWLKIPVWTGRPIRTGSDHSTHCGPLKTPKIAGTSKVGQVAQFGRDRTTQRIAAKTTDS